MGDTIDWLLSLTGQVEEWILGVADAWWVHLVVYLFAAFDGFFPSVPSESTIVTLSSLWASAGTPSIILIGLAAWIGAWTGDNLGYLIGSKIGWERFRFLREGRGRKAVEAADAGLQKRALVFLMTARYIPFGRTAVNLVAGAVHYPHRNFWPRSLLSTFVWAVYSCAIGAIAGAWFEDHHLLAITVALIAAVVMALIVERAITGMHRLLDRRAARREAAAQDERAESAERAESGDPAVSGERAVSGESAASGVLAVSCEPAVSGEQAEPVDLAAPADSSVLNQSEGSASAQPAAPGPGPSERPQAVAAGAESPITPSRGEESPA